MNGVRGTVISRVSPTLPSRPKNGKDSSWPIVVKMADSIRVMLLDEFAVLGRFSEIEAKAGYIRGYSVKLAYVIQGIGQLQQLYEKNWEAFVDNAAAMIAWGVNGKLSEDYIADRIGKVVVEETSYGENTGQSMSGIPF